MITPKFVKMVCRFSMAIVAVVIFSVAGINPVFAQGQVPQAPQQEAPQQEEISDEELKKFANAANAIQEIQMKAQEEMVQKVTDAGMDLERFNEIAEAQQNPEAEVEVSDEEEKQLETINDALGEIQEDTDSKMVEAVEEEGFTIERFQEIYAQLQSSPELQQRLQQLSQG